MIKIEFLQDYKNCHKKGDTLMVLLHVAYVWIEQGIAKRVVEPQRHKMVESPQRAKGHNIAGGYTG